MTITYKDADGIAGMRLAGRLAAEVLDYLTPFVVPGVSTNALDKLAHDYIVDVQGGIPAPLNYRGGGKIPSQIHLHLGQPPGLPRHSE